MPAKDTHHNVVRVALVNDGWKITDDPLTLDWGDRNLFVDLAAERLVSAEKAGRKIAVEIKSFSGASEVRDLENAIGQYQLYRSIMARRHPERTLYLAISDEVFDNLFVDDVGALALEDYALSIIVFNIQREEISKWIA
jgi:hypothetical protein